MPKHMILGGGLTPGAGGAALEGGGGNPDEPGWGGGCGAVPRGLPSSEHVVEQKPTLDSLKSADGDNQAPRRCSSQSWGEQGAAHFGLPVHHRLCGRSARLEKLCAQGEPGKDERGILVLSHQRCRNCAGGAESLPLALVWAGG